MSKKLLLLSCFMGASLYTAESAMPVSIFSADNGKKQEDRASAVMIKGNLFLGVYDGHGGSMTAELLDEALDEAFASRLSTHSVEEAFRKAIHELDNKAQQRCADGSTAVAAYIEDQCMHVFNIGDCRLIVEKNGMVDFATEDQTFKNAQERARVLEKNGIFFRFVDETTGKVTRSNPWRANALEPLRTVGDKWAKGGGKRTFESRGLGDSQFVYQIYKENSDEHLYDIVKNLTLTPQRGQIIADPVYTKLFLTRENRWLILASDGLTDVISSEQAVEFVVQHDKKGLPQDEIAQFLIQEAFARGSKDNITVILCDLLQLKKS